MTVYLFLLSRTRLTHKGKHMKSDFYNQSEPVEAGTLNSDCNVNKIFTSLVKDPTSLKRYFWAKPQQIIDVVYKQEPQYTNDFFDKNACINYCFGSFNDGKYGLQKSQLKTLDYVLRGNTKTYRLAPLKDVNKNSNFGCHFDAINGGPGVGKSTLSNFVLSNLLYQDLYTNIQQIQVKYQQACYFEHGEQIQDLKPLPVHSLKDPFYRLPSILLTGHTVCSVTNLSDLTKFNLEDCWIKPKGDVFSSLFSHLDVLIKSGDKDENQASSSDLFKVYLEAIRNISWDELKAYQQEYYDSFVKYLQQEAPNYPKNLFKPSPYYWKEIPTLLLKLMHDNMQQIQRVNNCIGAKIQINSQSNQNPFLNVEVVARDYMSLLHFKDQYRFDEDTDYARFQDIIKHFSQVISLQSYFATLLQTAMKKIQTLMAKNKQPFVRWFWSKKKVIKKSLAVWKQFFLDVHNHYLAFNKYQNDQKEKLFTSPSIAAILDELNIHKPNHAIDQNNYDSLIDDLSINFSQLEQQMDIKYRFKNTQLAHHLQEWTFLNELVYNTQTQALNLSKGRDVFQCLNLLCPILSLNLQKLRESFMIKPKFDYVIVDESSQISVDYALFFQAITDHLIALGDEKQLPPIKHYHDNDTTSPSFHNVFCQDLYDPNNLKLSSVLAYANYKSQWHSNLNSESQTECHPSYRGLYLLEHFRCPKPIFDLINNSFYESNLIYANDQSDYGCLFSKCIHSQNYVSCADTSLVYCLYDSHNPNINNSIFYDGKLNLIELEIGFNFLIDNYRNMVQHISNGKFQDFKKLSDNICFISLHKIQQGVANYIRNHLDNEKYLDDKELNKVIACISNDKPVIREAIKSLIYRLRHRLALNTIDSQGNQTLFKDSFLKVMSKINVGTIDSLQGIGADFIIFSLVKTSWTAFASDKCRINVLWTRTKKHFIQIMSDNYWEEKDPMSDKKTQFYLDIIAARKSVEPNIEDKQMYPKIVLPITNLNQSLDLVKTLSQNHNNDFQSPSARNSIIGRQGELAFQSLLNPQTNFKYALYNKLKRQCNLKLKVSDLEQLAWANQAKETYLPYDFNTTNNLYIDVKTSFGHHDYVFMGVHEQDFAQAHHDKYLIARISDMRKYNLNYQSISSSLFLLKQTNFYQCCVQDNHLVASNNDHQVLEIITRS